MKEGAVLMKKIKAILFDLDNTIIDREATFTQFIGDQYSRFIEANTSISKDTFVRTALRYDNFGYSPKSEVYAGLCADIPASIDPTVLEADFLVRYGDRPILFHESLDVLRTLSQIYPLGLVTNGRAKSQNQKIDRSLIREYFTSIKISGEEGVKKPDPELFHRCLRDLGVAPGECLFVGDHPENDIRSAKACGMRTVWRRNRHFSPPEQADGIIDSLSELLKI